MNDINPKASEHAEIREAVRAACTPFDSAYWQRVERCVGYPDDFVQAMPWRWSSPSFSHVSGPR